MDVWDALKLMARRWYVAVPMVVLTLTGAVLTLIYVKPHHVSDGHIMLLPPSTEVVPEQDQISVTINPWTTDSLMAAVVTRLGNRALEAELADEGYRATWEADSDLRFSSVVTIQTRSDSPGDAQATLQRLMSVVEAEVERQQEQYQLPPGSRITTLRLDAGENIELARGNQARALVVVVGIGGILTLLATVTSDVLLRSYARRRNPKPLSFDFNLPAFAGPRAGNGGLPAASPQTTGRSPDNEPTVPVSSPAPDAASQPAATPAPASSGRSSDDSTMVIPISRDAWEPTGDSAEGRGS